MTKGSQKKIKERLAKLFAVWSKQAANKPTKKEKLVHKKQLKKHQKDPVKFQCPKLVRGWWGE